MKQEFGKRILNSVNGAEQYVNARVVANVDEQMDLEELMNRQMDRKPDPYIAPCLRQKILTEMVEFVTVDPNEATHSQPHESTLSIH